MATPPSLEASGIETATTGGATKTFAVSVPSSLANSVLAFSIDWFEGSSSTVTAVTVSGSATGVVEVGTQQSGREGDSDNEGMWLGYKLAPASGSVSIVVTFSSSQSFAALTWVVLSGVDQAEPVDVFEDPLLRGNVTGHTFDLTPEFDNGFLYCAIHDNTDEANGSSSDLTQVTPTEDFTEAWFDSDTGPAGNQTWTWSATGTDRVTTGAVLFKAAAGAGELDLEGANVAFLATQAAALAVVIDAAGANVGYHARQAAALTAEVAVAAPNQGFLATQAAALTAVLEITGQNSGFLPTQAAALAAVLELTGQNAGFLATQVATVGTERTLVGANSGYLATQAAELAAVLEITGDNVAFLPTQQEAPEIGESWWLLTGGRLQLLDADRRFFR